MQGVPSEICAKCDHVRSHLSRRVKSARAVRHRIEGATDFVREGVARPASE
jgi:hypothetical protein